MKNYKTLAVLSLVFALLPAAAKAESKPWRFDWWPWHYSDLTFEKRYLHEGKVPQLMQSEFDTWTPETWTRSRGSEAAVMEGLYAAKIIKERDSDDGIPLIDTGHGTPILRVGPNFMRLSDKDKRRVVMYVDHVWHATDETGGTLLVEYRAWGKPVGIYTKDGLQLQ